MKHVIMGVARNEEVASFQQALELSRCELTGIMGWKDDDDCLYDYLLTLEQISELERFCSFELPRNLDLYLTCNS